MRRFCAVAAVVFCAIGLCGFAHRVQVPNGNWAFLTINPSSPGATIPRDFLGQAWNKGAGGFDYDYFQPGNTALLSFYQQLGPNGIFIIGGTPTQSSEAAPETLTRIQNWYNFLNVLGPGWRNSCVWQFNAAYPLGANDIAYAVVEAGEIESTFGSGVCVYSVGSEPDGYMPSTSAYVMIFNQFVTAVHAVYPAARFNGPELGNSQTGGAGWLAAFNAADAGSVVYETEHFYTGADVTTPALLIQFAQTRLGCLPNNNRLGQDPFIVSPLKMRLDQTGVSDVSGGISGVSNGAISATWAVDAFICAAKAGWIGVDLQFYCYNDGVAAPYSALNSIVTEGVCHHTNWGAWPQWAGVVLTSSVMPNAKILTVAQATSSGANLNVLGLLSTAGAVELLVANLDTANAVSIVPQSSAAWTTATATVIGSTSPSDLTININGVQMSSATGQCISSCPPTTFAKGGYVVIPAGGAALITLQ